MHIYVDGVFQTATSANQSRRDVVGSYPGFSGDHGYDVSFSVPTGSREVCIYGINVGQGVNGTIGCRALGGEPVNNLDAVTVSQAGRVRVQGWAFDPNDTNVQIPLHVYVAGVNTPITANTSRVDVGAAFGIGAQHGFDVEIAAPGGPVQVCVYAINAAGPGANVQSGCRSVTLPTGSPFGSLDGATTSPGSITVGGWSIDPDVTASTPVHIYVDGRFATATAANGARPDVGAVYPLYGASHGFSVSVAASTGNHQVCVYSIDIAGSGSNSTLGCRAVTVRSPDPFGSIDGLRGGPGSLTVFGWAIDPDTTAPTSVHVYVDGGGTAVMADLWRADVAAAFPGTGTNHGYTFSIAASTGTHTVCVYAINAAGAGSNQLLGCPRVTVSDPSPFGVIDQVRRSNGMVSVTGWALDPETTSSIDVHVYVNGQGVAVRADLQRPDVASAFGDGPAHGYSFTRPDVGSGAQSVCVYGINVGSGTNVLLGCRSV